MKSDLLETKLRILRKVKEAGGLIPDVYIPNLPPTELTKDVPDWHDFEHKIWMLGEEIRLLLVSKKSLRRDKNLQSEFVRIATNRNSKRGRQPFIMLLGYKFCRHHAKEISAQIDDPFVDGHVIMTLRKMRAEGYSIQTRPFLNSSVSWVRNEAKKYLSRLADG